MKLKKITKRYPVRRDKLLALLVGSLVTAASFGATYEANNVTELTNAIDRAANGSVIVLAATRFDLSTLQPYTHSSGNWGTMSTPSASVGTSCIWVKKRVDFKGANATSWREKTSDQETILDGGNQGTIFYCHGGDGRSTSFYHITFTNGVAASNQEGGGAIYAIGPSGDASKPAWGIVSNCVFRMCSAKHGGGTYAYTVFDSLYENCTATSNGGGAYAYGSKSYSQQITNRIDGCEFRSCSANDGGGAYHAESRWTTGARAGYVANCTFTNCTANNNGGALYEYNAGLVRGCRFEGNSSKTGALYGQYLYDETLVTNCTFIGNVSGQNGGGIGKWKLVADSAFTGNVATNTSGAAFNCTLLRGCGFTNNVALCVNDISYGGGALSNGTAIACTFVGNMSPKYGGAMLRGVASNCVFEANVSTNQGGACAWTAAVGCSFTGNRSLSQRGGAMYSGTATDCAFTNNYVSQNARGGACAYGKAKGCIFSGVGDVSCGSYDRCVFDGVVSAAAPNNQRYVFDMLHHADFPIYVTNSLVVNCRVKYLVNNEGSFGEFVNCTFADNTIDDDGAIIYCNNGRDYSLNKYFPGTNVLVNCLFSGNRLANGSASDLYLKKLTAETDFGFCSLQLYNCLYTAGVLNLDQADVNVSLVHGSPRFVAGDARFPMVPWYAIKRTSAARNTGINSDWMVDAVDMAGTARVVDGTVDIGCYECNLPPRSMRIDFR